MTDIYLELTSFHGNIALLCEVCLDFSNPGFAVSCVREQTNRVLHEAETEIKTATTRPLDFYFAF